MPSNVWLALGAAIVAASIRPDPAAAQRPLNLDFERSSVSDPDRPWGWTFGWSAFAAEPTASFALDSIVRRGGQRSLRIAQPDSSGDAHPQSILLQLPADFALGRDLGLAGWVKADGLRTAASITLEAWTDGGTASADTAMVFETQAPSSSLDWTRHALTIRVPRRTNVHSVAIALSLHGGGNVWFDDFQLSVDGVPMANLPGADPPTEIELAWLAAHSTPLSTTRVSDIWQADLDVVADIVGDARIVALGESTHGTREFFRLKHRVLEYLVRERGFTIFAIEANQLAVERINQYVQGGVGTARDVMRVMFRVWNTEGMLDMIEWMRAYNAAHPSRAVRFAGNDMQDHRLPADTLRAFLTRVEPALVQRFDELVGEYRAQASWATPQIPDTTRARWYQQADVFWKAISARRSAWLARASDHRDTVAVEWAVQAANLVQQAAMFNVALNSPERDSLMAANLDWFLRIMAPPGARAVVWAHDVHVSRGGDPQLSFNGGSQMGAYLSRTYGTHYRAFSLLTFEGAYSATRSFTDHRMIEAEAFPGPAGSIEATLHALRRPQPSVGWVVDLRPARTDDGGNWLRRPVPIRHIGYAAYDYGFELNAVLPLEFDAVLFIDRTTPSRLLP